MWKSEKFGAKIAKNHQQSIQIVYYILISVLTDIVRENVHILGEPILPIQLTLSIFGRSTHPVKVSKVIRPLRGPGAGTPGGILILPWKQLFQGIINFF